MARLGIDRDFLWEFGKLKRAIQEKVHAAFAKFEQATHAGVHLEKINNVRDTWLRSIRIDQSWRGIVLAPESGDSYTLLKVLPHDDAYDWACRRRVSVNRATGVIEVRDAAAIEERLTQLTEDAKASASHLLADVSDADDEALLRRIDVRHIDQIAYQITATQHGRLPVLPATEERDHWTQLITRFGLSYTETFLSQEWRHVVLAQGIASREEYLAVARSGRGRTARDAWTSGDLASVCRL